jgi:hypothetical protein
MEMGEREMEQIIKEICKTTITKGFPKLRTNTKLQIQEVLKRVIKITQKSFT